MMANVYKSPAQLKPLANTLEDLYTVPAGTQVVVSNIHICNLDSLEGTVRIAVRPDGATLEDKHYLFYELTLAGNDTVQLGDGITMDAGDIISVWSSNGETTFNMSYAEVT